MTIINALTRNISAKQVQIDQSIFGLELNNQNIKFFGTE